MNRANQPAYPNSRNVDAGMTIRERVATAALQGLLAHGNRGTPHEWLAGEAIAYADALIDELAKERRK